MKTSKHLNAVAMSPSTSGASNAKGRARATGRTAMPPQDKQMPKSTTAGSGPKRVGVKG